MLEIIGTLLGTALGGLIGYLVSIAAAQRLARSRAALNLRDAFKAELLALNPAHSSDASDIPKLLFAAFDKHRAAVFDFSWYLSPGEDAQFQEAWRQYYAHAELAHQDSVPYFEQYQTRGLDIQQIHERKRLVRTRIQRILDFAKPKPSRICVIWRRLRGFWQPESSPEERSA